MTDSKYSGAYSGINLSQELGFRTYQGTDCVWSSCCRETTHYHCRICGYGTSQTGNIISHRRICTAFSDYQQKELSRLTPSSDAGLLQHDVLQPPQSYSYFHTSGTSVGVPTQTTNSGSSNSKFISSQQNSMFNFVIPTQNSQYSSMYGPQNVFPNPNLFSPSSFNSFSQLDSTWLSQTRLIPPGVHSSNSTSDILGNGRSLFEKLDPSSSPSCCGRLGTIETTTIGMCSPLTAEAYKVVSKEFQSKLETQNWCCSSPSMLGFNNQSSSCKFSESASSCSVSLLLLEQNDLKQGQDCLGGDDTCFQICKTVEKSLEKKDCSNELAFNMNILKQEDDQNDNTEVKQQQIPSSTSIKQSKIDNLDLESLSVSEESDIIVEETESDTKESPKQTNDSKMNPLMGCLVCSKVSSSDSVDEFIKITRDMPVKTQGTHVSILLKLSQVINDNEFNKLKDCVICPRCLNLINVVDQLEIKLNSVKKELIDIYNAKDCDIEPPDSQTKETQVKSSIDEKLTCKTCDKQFSSANYLEKHKQCHTKAFSYYCEYCGKGFAVLQTLENHISLHSNTSRFQCELCGKRFVQKHNFNDHIKKHKGEYRYKCSICQKGFVRRSVLKTHALTHTTDSSICQHCGKQFKNLANLSVHIKICSGDLKFPCDKCDKKFPIRSLLKRHISIRHNSEYHFICGVCRKGFGKRSDLKTHMRSHSDSKPFQCSKCPNRYKSLSNLNQHLKVHSNGGVLECGICNKKFTRQDSLNDHMNQHTGNKPYKCTTCWKSFANRINYNIHVKRHNGTLKKTPCPICGKLFAKGMKDHLTSHSGQKPFSCKQCLAVFTVKSSLNKHLKSKHNIL